MLLPNHIKNPGNHKICETKYGYVVLTELHRPDGKLLITGFDFNRYSPNVKALNESEQRLADNGHLILSGKLQCAGVQNQNGRSYDRDILEREMNSYNDKIGSRLAMGELDHPEDSVINLKNVSHLITKMWWGDDGQSVMGNVMILPTPAGEILKNLNGCGIPIGMSSRGLGSVTESNGIVKVNSDFQLICFDAVSEPSTPGAFVDAAKGFSLKENFKKELKHDTVKDIISKILA